ncbi:P-loop containing nucleoside triphosphate hydrolase protein [Lophium mytilinum]|uniref:P-loop containing nucleoside triphosphate hydrolase protein n=1 Tax=Lophium mytilinum TaxID=390894 RepID=A0A6A6QYZ2_9PEZI|nr:P-loop containing nucleoside triphosphate hydrolase protein [Lophium mytilinum]
MDDNAPVDCPICSKPVKPQHINPHLDSGCESYIVDPAESAPKSVLSFFTPGPKRVTSVSAKTTTTPTTAPTPSPLTQPPPQTQHANRSVSPTGTKRSFDATNGDPPAPKRTKLSALQKAAPLPERMRPQSLDDVIGQEELVGPNGVIRSMIASGNIPSMILWGGPGTGKTTIARLIAKASNYRFVEIVSTSSGVGEVKKLFAEALGELNLTGRRTIIFCDEIHRFSKTQQDVFLGPIEAGQVTLIGATTENPSFKVVAALMSRCRPFHLERLTESEIRDILERALASESAVKEHISPLIDEEFLSHLALQADGDARQALTLLSLSLSLSTSPNSTPDSLRASLTKASLYDRSGDQHYDSISALHKSIRGSDPDATLYYLSRMLQSGEDPLYISRRLIVVASEDVGLADPSMLPLAVSAHQAVERVGMPEAGINIAHCAVALSMAKKSTRVYRGLHAAMAALKEPGVANLPVPVHLRNAPTRLMKEMGLGKGYKYNPDFKDGRVKQDYLPDQLRGRTFLDERDLGVKIDPDLESEEGEAFEGEDQGRT